MKNSSPVSQVSDAGRGARDLQHACRGWLLSGEIEGWSERTRTDRAEWLERFVRFLDDRPFDPDSCRAFFVALQRGDPAAGCKRSLRPASVKHAHAIIKAFGNWCVEETLLVENPMRRVPPPILGDPGIRPFEDHELLRLLDAAKSGRHGARDYAILALLADSGLRASELCSLRVEDLDLKAGSALIRDGKGRRSRIVTFGRTTAQALWRHLRAEPREQQDYLFTSERGHAFCRTTLRALIARIGKAAGVKGAHTHRLRHHAAVALLRGGAHAFAVQAQLGHARISTTQVYVQLAQSDLRAMAANSSPMDRLAKGTKR